MSQLDRRLNAYRPDLADIGLRDRVEATDYVSPVRQRIITPVADLRRDPAPDSGPQSQVLYGDEVQVFEQKNGWSWVQAIRDNYVGYVLDAELSETVSSEPFPTHHVCVPRSFVYPAADLRLRHCTALSLGSAVTVTGHAVTRGTDYALLDNGQAMIAAHLRPITQHSNDYVTTAETLLHTPYLWGGTSGFGIDCSGLVQLALRDAGYDVVRDSDMQAEGLGTSIDAGENFSNLRRGDLVFWPGHVAIMCSPDMMIHASGHTMTVTYEPLSDAITRIAYLYDQPSGFRRL